MGRGLFAHRDCSRYRTTFRRARGRRTVSLHQKSTISGECADGGGNRCSREPVGIHFFGGGELDFRLPPYPSRRKSPAAKPGRIDHAYCDTVPRFWPSLRSRVPAENRRPQWGQALGGESFVWLFGLAELLVAVTLRPLAALIAFPLGFLAHFLITSRIQKRGRQAGYTASHL